MIYCNRAGRNVSLHFGIWLTMDIGIFPWISAFCIVCFLPG